MSEALLWPCPCAGWGAQGQGVWGGAAAGLGQRGPALALHRRPTAWHEVIAQKYPSGAVTQLLVLVVGLIGEVDRKGPLAWRKKGSEPVRGQYAEPYRLR